MIGGEDTAPVGAVNRKTRWHGAKHRGRVRVASPKNKGDGAIPQILVMGAGGRIGRILRACWPEGVARWQSRGAIETPGAVQLDPLADPGALAGAAQGCDVVLCLSGAIPGRGATMRDNIALARAAIAAARAAGVPRVLLASSAAVYGRAGGLLRETPDTEPVSDYGRAKLAMERLGAGLSCGGVTVTSLRLGNIVGVDAIVGGWRPGFTLDVFADGRTPRRSYIGPVTLARVLRDLAGQGGLPPLLNLATPAVIEMGDLLDCAGLAWHPRVPPPEAIAEVTLDVAPLQGYCPMTREEAQAQTMVDEWRGLKAAGWI